MLILKVDSLFELLLGEDFIKPVFLLLSFFVLSSEPSCVSVCFYYHGKILLSCNVEGTSHSVILFHLNYHDNVGNS